MLILYRKNSLGLGTWRIWAENNVVHYCHSVVEGGAEVHHQDVIQINKSGRSLEEQVQLEITSRIGRMLDKGYKDSREEALTGATNQLGLKNPMLAQVLNLKSLPNGPMYVQPKFNGHRCLITKQDDNVIAYTRKGKLIHTIPEILADIANWLPNDVTLDGELYVHNMKLQQVSSLIKRVQPNNELLHFHAYDMISPQPFVERFKSMVEMHKYHKDPRIAICPTWKIREVEKLHAFFKQFRNQGYEGAMVRLDLGGYQDNKRSSQLLKMKEFYDTEVEVIDVKSSKDGWGICVCKKSDLSGDIIFDVSAPGNIAEKTEVLVNKHKYIGKLLTIEYAELTADGVPFHAVATGWREDL